MSLSFLEYYKLVLGKVSFDRGLFVKEYRKACRMLKVSEAKALRRWLAEEGYRHMLQEARLKGSEGQVVSLPRDESACDTSESNLPKAS